MTAGCDHKWEKVGIEYASGWNLDMRQARWCSNCGTLKIENISYPRGTQYRRPIGAKDKAPNTTGIPTTDSVNPEKDELLNRIKEQSGDL